MDARMSHPPAHRKERDERGTTQYLVIRFLAAFDRATCPAILSLVLQQVDLRKWWVLACGADGIGTHLRVRGLSGRRQCRNTHAMP